MMNDQQKDKLNQQIGAGLSQVEQQLDSEINAMENFGAGDFERLRKQRLQQLKDKQAKMKEWKFKGHGRYQEIADQKTWFEESKSNERMVCHFYRGTTKWCEYVDKHLEILAKKHLETRFIKIDAEKCNFLVERLNIVVMPTIIMTKNGMTEDRIEGFDELGGTENFSTGLLEARLAKKGAIEYDGDVKERLKAKKERERGSKFSTASSSNRNGKSIYGKTHKVYDSDSD